MSLQVNVSGHANRPWKNVGGKIRTDWKCPSCGAFNRYYWAKCPACNDPRP